MTPLLLNTHKLDHLLAYNQLPLLHRGPFDRLFVAQAKVIKSPIVTADPDFKGYELDIVW